jgi:hypothetical protein
MNFSLCFVALFGWQRQRASTHPTFLGFRLLKAIFRPIEARRNEIRSHLIVL